MVPSERLYESTKLHFILIFMPMKTSDLKVCIGLMFKKIRGGGINVSHLSLTVEHFKYR